jgi:CRP-like cAMP-binding protein
MKANKSPPSNPPIYLIVRGEVRIEMSNNPATKIAYFNEYGVDSDAIEQAHDTATGMGNLSRTISRAQVMCLSAGQWLGEELIYADMPIIYNAIALSDDVRTLRIEAKSLLEFN